MSIDTKMTDQFVYIHYVRENIQDTTRFKRKMENMLSEEVGDRDCIIDFTGSPGVISSEIGQIARLLNIFIGTSRFIRIVGTPQVINALRSTNIDTLENLCVYDNQKEFAEQLKKMLGKNKT